MDLKQGVESILKNENSEDLRNIVWKKYGEYMFGSGINKATELTKYQIAFLHLLSQKYATTIAPLITAKVQPEFDEWYEEPNSYNEISINAIDIRAIEEGSWQLMFENDNYDLIVHLYMKDWEFDYTARTG